MPVRMLSKLIDDLNALYNFKENESLITIDVNDGEDVLTTISLNFFNTNLELIATYPGLEQWEAIKVVQDIINRTQFDRTP